MHLRLVGEVFSPERFTKRAQQFELSAGRAFDLQLGDQFLCPKNRKLCIEHILNEDYGLVVVTPPCTMFSYQGIMFPGSRVHASISRGTLLAQVCGGHLSNSGEAG